MQSDTMHQSDKIKNMLIEAEKEREATLINDLHDDTMQQSEKIKAMLFSETAISEAATGTTTAMEEINMAMSKDDDTSREKEEHRAMMLVEGAGEALQSLLNSHQRLITLITHEGLMQRVHSMVNKYRH
jgi:hypothetical protein